MIVYSYWLLKGVDTEQLYMIELSHIETGDNWDMWDSVVAMDHRIELEEFFDKDVIEQTSKRVLKAEARRILRKELEIAYQTQYLPLEHLEQYLLGVFNADWKAYDFSNLLSV